MSTHPLLFSPLQIRDVTLNNRVVVSPMCQYTAEGGYPVPHHLVHYGKFAMGGAGLIFLEATGVTPEGRITNGCLGLWEDEQTEALKPIAAYIKGQGSVPGIQLGHGGRKASMQRPWHGNGPQTADDVARGDTIWQTIGASAMALDDGWLQPKEMTLDDMAELKAAFAAAAGRAIKAGFEAIEIHMAHGYLLQTFLTPLANHRDDAYGGSLENRMRFPLEVAETVRAAVPDGMPLFVRISSVDGIEGGWEMADSLVLVQELKARGIDVIDCSSGGNTSKGSTNASLARGPGFQAPFAAEIKAKTGIMTQAVGLIREPQFAEDLLQNDSADLIALGRQLLFNPFWPVHAAEHFGLTGDYEAWPKQYAWWLEKWDKGLRANGERP